MGSDIRPIELAAQYAGSWPSVRGSVSLGEWIEGCLDDITDWHPEITAEELAVIATALREGVVE